MSPRIHGNWLCCARVTALGAALFSACTQRLVPPAPFELGPPASSGAAVEASAGPPPRVDEPDSARLLADVTWLADDARAGRRAGTAGSEAAAAWIAARLGELGLEPAGSEGCLQPFEVPLPPRDPGGSDLIWTQGVDLGSERVVSVDGQVAGGGEVVPLFCSAEGRVAGPLRFGGYGIVDPERGREDLAGHLRGAVLLVARGAPPGPDGAPPEVWGHAGTLLGKVLAAKHRGVGAVLVAQHPDDPSPPPPFARGASAEAGIPCLSISFTVAERLLPGYSERVRWLDGGEGAVPVGGWATLGTPEPGLVNVVARACVSRERGMTANVLARVPGRGEGGTVVVGAHFDHLGLGDTGSLAPDQIGVVHNGADDNASGTAVALEVARLLAAGPAPAGDVVIALWSGEELGLLGSKHWIGAPTAPLEEVVAYVNLDMVGRAGDGSLSVLGAGSAAEFGGWMEAAGQASGLALQVSASGRAMGGSDHMSFLGARIPSLALFSGVHTDYHRPSDDAERVEADGMARVAALTLDLVARCQEAGALSFVEPPPPAEGEGPAEGGFRAWFGSVPEYAAEGVTGVLLAGTSPGSPAEAAGLQGGDVLKAIGEIEMESIYDLVHALSTYKAGDTVLVVYERAGVSREVRLTLSTRGAR